MASIIGPWDSKLILTNAKQSSDCICCLQVLSCSCRIDHVPPLRELFAVSVRYLDKRQIAESSAFSPPKKAEVDGDPAEWWIR